MKWGGGSTIQITYGWPSECEQNERWSDECQVRQR